MAHIDALVDKVADAALRDALRAEVATMLSRRSFGLVFQEHRPETVELPQHRVRRGYKVRVRDEEERVLYRVERVSGPSVSITSLADPPSSRSVDRSAVVVVREFGDPVYPGLTRTGRVHRGGDKPSHVVINAENFHALETLLYTHAGKVDAIYIDPPYNTRDKDWKYNNDYVDASDVYRHSKWLAMMQRRLRLAKLLLNPESSVLVVTIDEKEYLRLGLLLEQLFPDAEMQMVSSVINRKGNARRGEFSRCDEYLYFIRLGDASVNAGPSDMLYDDQDESVEAADVRWKSLLRLASTGQTKGRFNLFYPLFFDSETLKFLRAGDPLPEGVSTTTVKVPEGESVLWPISKDGSDGRWSLSRPKLDDYIGRGFVKFGRKNSGGRTPYYLMSGQVAAIESGALEVVGRDEDGAVSLRAASAQKQPMTIWNRGSHSTSGHGATILRDLIPGRSFPYPKSLYAVEDALRFFLADKPEAQVLDFFAGSGTTLHAVARLNKQDGGRRQCICVTNNEVSDAEARALLAQGHRPGDEAWESLGICEYITKPRIEAAFTGRTHLGEPVAGEYKYSDRFPVSDGLDENVEFFNLTYEDGDLVSLGKKFEAIASLLWLKAGGRGSTIETVAPDWSMPAGARYGVLFDTNLWRDFVDAATEREDLAHIYVVTDSEATFQQIASELPRHLDTTQLYEDYLHNFQINTRGRM